MLHKCKLLPVFICSVWRMSAFHRASTAPNIPPTLSQQPPSRTRCRQSPCLMLSTSAWSSLRSLVPKTFTTRYWSVPRRLLERVNIRGSCRLGLTIQTRFVFFLHTLGRFVFIFCSLMTSRWRQSCRYSFCNIFVLTNKTFLQLLRFLLWESNGNINVHANLKNVKL